MSVVIETTLGDITVDLYTQERPKACRNFLKLCKVKYYNFNLFHTVQRNFIAQTGDPTGSRRGGESIFGVLEGSTKRYFEAETKPPMKHTQTGLISFVTVEENMIGSQFFITLSSDLSYLDHHCIFGEVVEGFDVLALLNKAICNGDNRPYQDIRITHTVVLDDPFEDLRGLKVPSRSPSPSADRMQSGLIPADEDIEDSALKDSKEMEEIVADREAKARATILEMVGDIPDAEMAPPENVLFVCKLNPVTTSDDLEIIFNRFGKINTCEVIRDKKTGDSLQYAFIEFNERKFCEDAYFKMDNVLIDDRRIHVDFSQSVAKIKWLGKGRGVKLIGDSQAKQDDRRSDKRNEKRTRKPSRDREDYDGGKRNKNKKKREPSRDRHYSKKYRERSSSRDRSRSHHKHYDSDRSKSGRHDRSEKSDRRRSSYKDKRSTEYSTTRDRHERRHRDRSRSR